MAPRIPWKPPRAFAAAAFAGLLSLTPGRGAPRAQQPAWELDAEDLRAEFDRYRSRAASLKRYRESGELDGRQVLQLLRAEGVFEPSNRGSLPGGFRPFQVRVYGGLWRWPLRAGIVSSEFGRRWGRRHEGIDIAADLGVPVLAAASGVVLYAGARLRGYGNAVVLRHDQSTVTLYAHNAALLVRAGQRVSAGQAIATLGSTGRSTGPHIHFEIRKRGRAVNPRRLLVRGRF